MKRQVAVILCPNTDTVYANEMPPIGEMVDNFKNCLGLFHATKRVLKFAAGLTFDDETGELIQVVTHTGKIFDIPKQPTIFLEGGKKVM